MEDRSMWFKGDKTIATMTGCWCPPNRQVTLFKHSELIKSLPDNFLKMLVTHSPVHQNIFKYYDIVLYDNNNVVDEKRQFSFGTAESMLIRQGLLLAKYYGMKLMYKFGFDLLPDDIFRIYDWLEHIEKGYKMVTHRHGNPGVGTFIFLVDVDWALKYLPEYRTVDEMFGGCENQHLEISYGKHIVKNGQMDKVYFYNSSNKMFSQKIGNVEFYDDCQGCHQDENLLAKYKE